MPQEVYSFSDLQRWSEVTADEKFPLRLAVFGDPVAHSASPPMHNAALEKCGIAARYTRLHILPGQLSEALRLLPRAGFIGANLTIPHKAPGLQFMDRVDTHARRVGVVNTVVVEGNELVGFNTDGPGLVRAVRSEFGVDLRDLRVLVLGAGGGAGRAVAMQCAIEQCVRLTLVNRTVEKAAALAEELSPLFSGSQVYGPLARLAAIGWEEPALRTHLAQTDLIINCSSLGMKRTDPSPLDSSLLEANLLVFDTVYTSARTRLMQAADEAGARSANGLAMLLHQGALSFEVWFNREAPLDVMRAALKGHAAE
jgi:shikimate dehydrogenase